MNLIEQNTIKIKEAAIEVGFHACGISKAGFFKEDEKRLKKWLNEGMHGDMKYMENYFDKRLDATRLVKNAKSVISVLLSYYTDVRQTDPDAPVISKYAFGRDYHEVMKKKLRELADIINQHITTANGRIFVDSAPVLERSYAYKAGMGWIGKNANLIHKKLGSFVFIGELIVDVELEYDEPEKEHCGNCTRCMDACPTKAITEPGVIDARKCISYLTIEHKGILPEQFKKNFNNRIFGCDICQDVCPWNHKLVSQKVPELQPNSDILNLTKEEWKQLTENQYNRLFKHSPVKRTGYENLKRNINFIKYD